MVDIPWDWDEEQSSEGVAHQSVPDTDHDNAAILKQGYDYLNFSEITPDPVACWPLHEDSGSTAHDVAGTLDGAYNGPTLGQEGLLGTTAASLDGADDYVGLGSPSSLTFGNGTSDSPFSILAWVKMADATTFRIVTHTDSGGDFQNREYAFTTNADDELIFVLYDPSQTGSSYQLRADGPAMTTNEGDWTLVGATYDGSSTANGIDVYIDGTNETQSTSLGADYTAMNNSADAAAIGSFREIPDYASGDFADIRVYGEALTQSQIQTQYDVVDSPGTWTGVQKTA